MIFGASWKLLSREINMCVWMDLMGGLGLHVRDRHWLTRFLQGLNGDDKLVMASRAGLYLSSAWVSIASLQAPGLMFCWPVLRLAASNWGLCPGSNVLELRLSPAGSIRSSSLTGDLLLNFSVTIIMRVSSPTKTNSLENLWLVQQNICN